MVQSATRTAKTLPGITGFVQKLFLDVVAGCNYYIRRVSLLDVALRVMWLLGSSSARDGTSYS